MDQPVSLQGESGWTIPSASLGVTALGVLWIIVVVATGLAQDERMIWNGKTLSGGFSVLSVTDDGILVHQKIFVNGVPTFTTPVFVKGRFNYVDGDALPPIRVTPAGTYRYQTAIGSQATVRAYEAVAADAVPAAPSTPRPTAQRPSVGGVTETTSSEAQELKLPSGKLVETDHGAVLTLPSGEKFISETLRDTDGSPQADILIFPNGQKFTSETAKGVGHVPFVSTDGAVVAIARIPATQTSTLHIYFKDPTGNFREIENANEQVAKLLTGVKVKWPPNYDPPQEAAKYGLDVLSMSGHTLTLNCISYREGESKTYQFKVTVAPDGSLALAK